MCIFIAAVIFPLVHSAFSDFPQSPGNGNACVCVPRHACRDNESTVNGEGLMDIRLEKGVCGNYFEICCENPSRDVHEWQSSTVFSGKGCGYQNPMGIGYRITGDSLNAHFAELPWTVVVLYREQSEMGERNIYKCGGSLIHHQVVITAAHCVAGALEGQWTIRAGEWDTRSQDELMPHQDRLVEEIVLHQHYRAGSLKNDIALLFLGRPVDLAENVALICLPPPGYQAEAGGPRCIASGWGRDAFKKGKHSSVLKKIELPIVSRDDCIQSLRNTRLGQFYNLHRSFVCAGGEGAKDTCKGDGGSPLVCPVPAQPGRYLQVGIVSWGIGCGEDNTPGVYANVALYRDWVDKQLGARSFDTSLYKYE